LLLELEAFRGATIIRPPHFASHWPGILIVNLTTVVYFLKTCSIFLDRETHGWRVRMLLALMSIPGWSIITQSCALHLTF